MTIHATPNRSEETEQLRVFSEFWYCYHEYIHGSRLVELNLSLLGQNKTHASLFDYNMLCRTLGIKNHFDGELNHHNIALLNRITRHIDYYLQPLKALIFADKVSIPSSAVSLNLKTIENTYQALALDKRRLSITPNIEDMEQTTTNALILSLYNSPPEFLERICLCFNSSQAKEGQQFIKQLSDSAPNFQTIQRVFARILNSIDNRFASRVN